MFKRMKLGTKLLAAFLFVGLLPFAVVSYLSVNESSEALSTQAFSQLESIREIKTAQIEGFFSERFGDVVVLSSNGSVIEALNAFENAYSINGKEVGSDLWKRVEKQYGQWLHHYNEQYGYYDLFLISKAGEVVYTVAKESDLGANLKRGALKDSSLGEAYRKGLTGPTLVDFKAYAPSNDEPASFIAAPVTDADGEVFGVVALQISLDAINSIMASRAGMGGDGRELSDRRRLSPQRC